jgi:hypothetical protein
MEGTEDELLAAEVTPPIASVNIEDELEVGDTLLSAPNSEPDAGTIGTITLL